MKKPRQARPISHDEQIARYAYVLGNVPASVADKAFAAAFAQLSEAQRRVVLDELRAQVPAQAAAPTDPDPESFAHEEGSPVYQELFVAADGPAVRGGYTLQHRKAAFRDEECAIGSWYQPISEGSVDPRALAVRRSDDGTRSVIPLRIGRCATGRSCTSAPSPRRGE